MFNGLLIRAWHLKNWGRLHFLLARPAQTLRFLLKNRETTNFTYEISNTKELARFLADALGESEAKMASLIGELEQDRAVKKRLQEAGANHSGRNAPWPFGRRAGWYAAARVLRPARVIETGTADGLGTAVLAQALLNNKKEGFPGVVHTFDLDANAGWLVPDFLRPFVQIETGDIRETLPASLKKGSLHKGVDLFIHDSGHTYEHESFELETVVDHVRPGGLIMTDNAHITTALKDLAGRRGLEFRYWQEVPRGHPYPGGGIGLVRKALG